ncbi:MAG: PLP-dependent transferase [Candidatus Eisenbacteria bacterium]
MIGGVVIVQSDELRDHLRFIQKSVGAVPSLFDCWLTMLGIKTLPIRMERHSENAMKVARFLEEHDKVAWVRYPGLKSHPQHEVAAKQMSGFSGMITFELKGGIPSGKTLLNSCRMISLAESLGAVETMITHPATMTHAEVPVAERHARGLTDGLVRLSVGIEDVSDILADLEQALDKA